MRKEKRLKTLRRYALPVLVLIFIGAVLLLCRARVQTEYPVLQPADGVVDAREANFADEVYHVINDWSFYPGTLYTPADFADPVTAPRPDQENTEGAEKGTWRLVILAEPDTYLTLCHFSVDFSTRIFVNGKEMRNIGFVSDDPDEAVPKVR